MKNAKVVNVNVDQPQGILDFIYNDYCFYARKGCSHMTECGGCQTCDYCAGCVGYAVHNLKAKCPTRTCETCERCLSTCPHLKACLNCEYSRMGNKHAK